ncbi:MAG: response regulator transcription factor [Candidatus Krumholzibacteriota bacterium]|nr:response regulator transcription factor [Candidatus Krumholzibacteriota bacterium]
MDATILIIDDDAKLNERLGRYLDAFGLAVVSATRPTEGLRLLETERPDLVILDVMMPEMDGFEALREMRGRGDVPVIMLTARGDVDDRIAGLELGADDYLPKPFDPRELVARIQTVLRRHRAVPGEGTGGVRRFGDLAVDTDRGSVELAGEPVALTDLEFGILAALVSRAGEAVGRDTLAGEIRGIERSAVDRSLDVAVSRLRQKLGDDPKRPRFIKTAWGTGYSFIGEESP